ncbi:M3 family oligoendopeptidase [Rhodocaloribacter litoris]|uniref:M3 family oligoendopeptidase n=1 Tax=Rhodocaloribacter litoris TaxID=2558931 RepID=UPI001E58A213|nr:M3 family oligoendopeptidase [Rhodocaloribacter litoris]
MQTKREQIDTMETTVTGAESVHWDLTDLYTDQAALDRDLETAAEEAGAFEDRYRGRVAGLDAGGLAGALVAYERLHDRLGRAYTYAYLYWSTDTGDPARGALLQKVREAYTQIAQRLIFFRLEWAAVDDDRAEALLADPLLATYRHYLELERLHRRHLLSEPEEKILSEKAVTGRGAWNRFFDETLGAMRFTLDGRQMTQQEVLAKLYEPDREVRRTAALAFTGGLEANLRPLTFIFNTILADKASDDRLRGYPHWLAARNLENEVEDEMVQALIEAVTGRYDLVARFYRLKRRLLGLDELFDYDRYAPVGEADTRYDWDAARELVQAAYADFHPRLGEIVEQFFEKRWIDAALAPNKRGGAFSHGAVPSAHPYILMNYTGKIRDVQTLAHELGHGVHQYLSRKQGVLQADTPLTTAETASVFGEMLVFQRLMQQEQDPRNRLAMLVGKIDDTIATVFRQVAMNRFEDRMHTARRTEGELPPEWFCEAWMDTQRAMFQGSVTLGDHYRFWWSYIPHFLHTPGYVYAYAFGELLVLALYARYREEGPAFADKYIGLLEAGGSDWPHRLVGRLGVDLTDPGFWHRGLSAIEALIEQAEALAAASTNGAE